MSAKDLYPPTTIIPSSTPSMMEDLINMPGVILLIQATEESQPSRAEPAGRSTAGIRLPNRPMYRILGGAEMNLSALRGEEICITAKASGMISAKPISFEISMEPKDTQPKEK